jgi:hypothetical protein
VIVRKEANAGGKMLVVINLNVRPTPSPLHQPEPFRV